MSIEDTISKAAYNGIQMAIDQGLLSAPVEKLWVSTKEAESMMGVSRDQIRKWISEGHLHTMDRDLSGRSVLISVQSLRALGQPDPDSGPLR